MKKATERRAAIGRHLAIILLFLTASIAARAGVAEVEALLQRYERQSDADKWQPATELLQQLHSEDEGYVAIKFTAASDTKEIAAEVYVNTCDYFYNHNDYDRAIVLGEKALAPCKGGAMEADLLNVLAMSHMRLAHYEQAASYAKQCYALDARGGDHDMMSSSLNTIAGIYMAANQPQEAEKYILKAIAEAHKVNNPARLAVLEGMASEIYHAQVNDNKALDYINRSIEHERQLGKSDRLLVRQVQKASVLNGLKRYTEAEKLLKQIMPDLEASADRHTLAIACNKLGMALFSLNREREAVPYFRRAAAILQKLGDLGNELHSRRGLYESLWYSNPDSAKIELDRFDLIKDSLYRTASAQGLARINAELDNDWLRKSNSEKQATIRRQRVIIVAGILATILIALGIWWWMRRRMRRREAALRKIIDELQKPASSEPTAATHALSSDDRDYLNRIVTIVERALPDGDLSIEAIADAMCTTRGNLNRKVKSITGNSTQQFVLGLRVEHACRLLGDSDTAVTDVGHRCGFDNAVTFSRAFKRIKGVSPTQYRAEYYQE